MELSNLNIVVFVTPHSLTDMRPHQFLACRNVVLED